MQRFVNNPDFIVDDMLKGLVKANPEVRFSEENDHVISMKEMKKGKVGVITGGGSGHEPAFVGYLGDGMLDSVAIGEVFASPPALAFYDAIVDADQGEGVAVLFGNYAGDNMNVKMAMRKAKKLGIEVKTVVANDDCASAPKTELEKRRGVAGEVLMWKVGGAKASMGGSLDEVIAVAQKAIDNTRSVGIGTAPCTIPAVGHPNFQIEDGTMEVGIGHHGEPGINVQPLKTADDIAEEMLDIIIPDLPFESGDEVVVLLSGLGATPVMEQYIVYNRVEEILTEKGIKVQHGIYIGTQGPTFETPAEYKLFHILGADAVGMSTVPEVIVANHCGIKVFGISVITDLGVEGKIVEVTHEEVQKAADAAQPKMTTIMRELINRA